jgi:hypothetical protein
MVFKQRFGRIFKVAKSFDLAFRKIKCKSFGLWLNRKVIAYRMPYFSYTSRWHSLNKTSNQYDNKRIH